MLDFRHIIMMYTIVGLLTVVSIITRVVGETSHEESIQCVCTTRQCQENGEAVCITNGLCYSQYLDRNDGTNPWSKGCVGLKTPLLCENRPPKSMSFRIRWPILLCCRTNMCDQNDSRLPQLTQTVPAIHQEKGNASRSAATERKDHAVLMLNNNQNNTLSNPTVLTVFCLGLGVLLLIGITGCCVLQRQQFY